MVNIKSFLKKYRWLIASGISVFVFFFWFFPEIYIYSYFKHLTNKESLESIQTIRTLILQISAGILALVGINLTWRRTKALDTQNQTNIDHLEELRKRNEQDKKSNDDNLILQQFSKASELLADETSITARLSGIYLFEKIMNTSEEYHWQIIELLTAYVREKRDNKKYDLNLCKESDHFNIDRDNDNGPFLYTIKYSYEFDEDGNNIPKYKQYYCVPVEKDIQAILTVIGRRNRKLQNEDGNVTNFYELCEELGKAILENNVEEINRINFIFNKTNQIDLKNVNLYKANLCYLHFENSDFSATHLIHSDCEETHFEKSNLSRASFEYARCEATHFEKTQSTSAHFDYANCIGAHFEYSQLLSTKFLNSVCVDTHFRNANLTLVKFDKADCIRTDFNGVIFKGSRFVKANLDSADFAESIGIKAIQLCEANIIRNLLGLSDEIKEEIVKYSPKFKKELFPNELPSNKTNEEI